MSTNECQPHGRRAAFDFIDFYVTPVWYILGIPGNILATLVWIQRRMRPSSGCYLAALALDECIFLILQLFYELQTKWGVGLLQYPGICEIFSIVFITSQHLSPLFVLGFTLQRYVSVCHPFQRDRFCTTSRTVISIAFFVVFTLLINAVQGYFWAYVEPRGEGSGECSPREDIVDGWLWEVYSWITETIIFGVVPIVILILNILVIRETRRLAHCEETMMLRSGSSKAKGSSAALAATRPSATTLMLVAVSSYLIVTTIPVTICYVLYPTFKEGDNITMSERPNDPVWRRHYVYNELRTVIYEIGMSHYACNFYIYLLTGLTFRRQLIAMMRACVGRPIDRNHERWLAESASAEVTNGRLRNV